ncbi:MAG: LptF/LptG family permease, partial [Phycisphaerae bacterium]|nr:LptF/LptG family permease [Phycisphaerae bacterium]
MVFTLHRYIFKDLFKAFTLTTIILSFVMGLGVMLKPLRDFSIDPVHVPEMIFCTLPITMTMAIPIAALMATTLVYGRLAFENEITACRSSGIGLLTLIYPALMLALLVGMITL